jgi:hypothetical protein
MLAESSDFSFIERELYRLGTAFAGRNGNRMQKNAEHARI